MSEDAIKIFYSYSRKDLDMRNALEDHLSALREAGKISTWHDLELEAGTEWELAILQKLDTADMILLLISSSFIASKYCYGTELKRAIARHDAGTARVIPIILRPCDWNHPDVPFSKLNALPTHAKPITQWEDRDDAFAIVAQRIRETVDQLNAQKLVGHQTEEEKQHQAEQLKRETEAASFMPQHVSLTDIATLKNDAYWAERKQNWDLAEQLWVQVLAVASGQDIEAIEALQSLNVQRHTRSASNPLNESSHQIEQQAQSSTPPPPVKPASKCEAVYRSPTSPPPVNPAYKREVFLTPKLDRSSSLEPSAFSNASPDLKETIERQKSPENVRDNLISDREVDYRRLQDLLKVGRWKEANQETVELMLRVVDRAEPIDLLKGGINEFPDTDLRTIDQLWRKYSKGRFGFSIQKKIYLECGGEPDGLLNEEAWVKFNQRVRWCMKGDWIESGKIAFYASAPEGHLPMLVEPFKMYISAESLESLFLRQDL